MREITLEMVRSIEWTENDLWHLSGKPDSAESLIGDFVSDEGRLFFDVDGELHPHHFQIDEWAI